MELHISEIIRLKSLRSCRFKHSRTSQAWKMAVLCVSPIAVRNYGARQLAELDIHLLHTIGGYSDACVLLCLPCCSTRNPHTDQATTGGKHHRPHMGPHIKHCGSYGVRRVWRLGCQGRVENAGSKAPTGPPKWHPKRTRKHQKGVQNDQNGTRNRHQRAQKGQNDPPGARRRIFGAEKEAFSTKGLIVFGAKIDLKSINKRTKKHCGFRARFGGSFSRFWLQKWCQNGAEGVPKAIQKRLRVTKAGFRCRPQKQMVSEGKAGFGSSTLKPTALQNL